MRPLRHEISYNRWQPRLLVLLFVWLALLRQTAGQGGGGAITIIPEGQGQGADVEDSKPAPGEQERIDTIVRTFNRLPAPELERLGVDITSEPIVQGSAKAEQLKRAWLERQKELKQAMESMTKPAEHMAELAKRIKEFIEGGSADGVEQTLDELESLLSDVDNARDFHTIGGWPVLTALLAPEHSSHLRAKAALAVGTAVKNSYDYQLWVLERRNNASSLDLLLDMLEPQYESAESNEETHRRALYALSSAARGNTDVQAALLLARVHQSHRGFLDQLTSLAVHNFSTPEITRKVWSFAADMLEESLYVRTELAAELGQGHQEQLLGLKMLGDALCSTSWASLASSSLRRLGTSTLLEAPQRATLQSVLIATATMLQLCPEQLASSADLSSVLSGQVRQLHDLYSASAAATATRPPAEGSIVREEIEEEEDDLDERLLTSFAEEVVVLSGKILGLGVSSERPIPPIVNQ